MDSEIKVEIKTFENSYQIISSLVERKRADWTFKASLMNSFDDIKIIIITHINKKFHLYDQSKPLEPWVMTVTNNKFKNILRDIYLSTSPPCSQCACNLGGDFCSLFQEKGPDCPLYAEWAKSKRYRHEARMPLALELHSNEIANYQADSIDIEEAAQHLHNRIKPFLTPSEWEIYKRLFIECLTEEETAAALDFKTGENGRSPGYNRMSQVKKKAVALAKKLLAEFGLETNNG